MPLVVLSGKILTDNTALSWRSCCSLHGQRSFNPSSVDSSSSGRIPLPCSCCADTLDVGFARALLERGV